MISTGQYYLYKLEYLICMILLCMICIQYAGAKPEEVKLENISYRIAYGKVIIEYDLIGPSDKQFKIELILKREMTDSFRYEPINVSGDIGTVKNAGNKKQIIWDLSKEFPEWLNPNDKDYYFVVNVYLVSKGINPLIWIGGGAAILGGGAALLLFKKDSESTPTVIKLPNPPGRP